MNITTKFSFVSNAADYACCKEIRDTTADYILVWFIVRGKFMDIVQNASDINLVIGLVFPVGFDFNVVTKSFYMQLLVYKATWLADI